MGRIDVILDDETEKKLREEVFKRYGMKRGNLTEAIHEAIVLWLTEDPKRPSSKNRV